MGKKKEPQNQTRPITVIQTDGSAEVVQARVVSNPAPAQPAAPGPLDAIPPERLLELREELKPGGSLSALGSVGEMISTIKGYESPNLSRLGGAISQAGKTNLVLSNSEAVRLVPDSISALNTVDWDSIRPVTLVGDGIGPIMDKIAGGPIVAAGLAAVQRKADLVGFRQPQHDFRGQPPRPAPILPPKAEPGPTPRAADAARRAPVVVKQLRGMNKRINYRTVALQLKVDRNQLSTWILKGWFPWPVPEVPTPHS